MKKRLKSLVAISALLSMTVLVAAGCEEDDNNDDQTLLLLGAAYLLTGNCAIVRKDSSTTYTVAINGVPNGGCNVDTILGSTRAQGVTNVRNSLTRTINAYTTASASACATNISTTQTSSAAITETNFCGQVISSNSCDTEARWAEETGKRRFFGVGSGRTEALASILNTAGLTLSAAQVASARLASPDESSQAVAIFAATGDCKTALIAAFPTVARSAVLGLTSTTAVDGSTAVANIASPILLSATCVYGSASTDTNRCATLRTEF